MAAGGDDDLHHRPGLSRAHLDGEQPGEIVAVGTNLDTPGDVETIDGTGLIALPGLVDLHTHLREPGREDAETVLSGSIVMWKSPGLHRSPVASYPRLCSTGYSTCGTVRPETRNAAAAPCVRSLSRGSGEGPNSS